MTDQTGTLVAARDFCSSTPRPEFRSAASRDLRRQLEARFGPLYLRQRLGIEDDLEARATRLARRPMHSRRWYRSPGFIRRTLKLTGLYWWASRNAARIEIRRHPISLPGLPAALDRFTILQISDLHVDISPAAMQRLAELLPQLSYDLCVLTGDYRGKTYGPWDATIEGMARIRACIAAPVYAVLGNHDSLRMVPPLEEMGIRMLVNEAEPFERDGQKFYLAGIDDAHYYRLDNIEKAASQIPHDAFSLLLSHTPEIYRQAAHADFDLMLAGHTHGGQICLPGAIPLTLDSALPRRMGAGSWRYGRMIGYTSVGVGSSIVAARINCPPEITLHELHRVAAAPG
ncbi:MAG TPA: metallophosphoesterase [Stellaceae bacterium]|nr:metallophosphoesterase [Stellaceae bacterium]